MKKSLLVVILAAITAVLFMSCAHTNHLGDKPYELKYAKDYKTDLCFAYLHPFVGTLSFSNVLCTKKVLDHLNGEKRMAIYYGEDYETGQCFAYLPARNGNGWMALSTVPCTKKVLREVSVLLNP